MKNFNVIKILYGIDAIFEEKTAKNGTEYLLIKRNCKSEKYKEHVGELVINKRNDIKRELFRTFKHGFIIFKNKYNIKINVIECKTYFPVKGPTFKTLCKKIYEEGDFYMRGTVAAIALHKRRKAFKDLKPQTKFKCKYYFSIRKTSKGLQLIHRTENFYPKNKGKVLSSIKNFERELARKIREIMSVICVSNDKNYDIMKAELTNYIINCTKQIEIKPKTKRSKSNGNSKRRTEI